MREGGKVKEQKPTRMCLIPQGEPPTSLYSPTCGVSPSSPLRPVHRIPRTFVYMKHLIRSTKSKQYVYILTVGGNATLLQLRVSQLQNREEKQTNKQTNKQQRKQRERKRKEKKKNNKMSPIILFLILSSLHSSYPSSFFSFPSPHPSLHRSHTALFIQSEYKTKHNKINGVKNEKRKENQECKQTLSL
uniref:Uncharacterized protein n=1 Tax=Trypanosoma vivax (strain Y486) TaxID=1055687 RepID=G0U441_TRYVY|nr:hypothetical protein, unlikely [Trypanosoma vivax Y486]